MKEHELKRQFFSGSTTLTSLMFLAVLLLLLPDSQAVVQLVTPTTAAKNETIASAQAAKAAPTKTVKRCFLFRYIFIKVAVLTPGQ